MKKSYHLTAWGTIAFLTFCLLIAGTARAAGTAAGTTITSNISVSYNLGGVTLTAAAGNSFVVDDKVMVTVTANDVTAVTTYPSSNSQAMKFTVSNTGNTVHDFALTAASIAATTVVGATVAFYADTNGNGTYDPGTDLILPVSGTAYIDELAADASRVVFLVITVPSNATNGQTANYSVTAEAHQGGGVGALGALTKTQADADKLIADNPATVQIVLADAAGDGDAAFDGKFTKNGSPGFLVAAAPAVSLNKIVTVISDPWGGNQPVPGATLQYTIKATASGTANNVVITDMLPTKDTVYIPNTLKLNNAALTDAADADAGDVGGTTADMVTVKLGNLTGEQTITFNVKIK